MASVILYRYKKNGTICLQFSHRSSTARHFLPVAVADNQWKDRQVVNHPRAKELNVTLRSALSQAEMCIMRMREKEPLHCVDVCYIRDKVVEMMYGTEEEVDFVDIFNRFAHTHAERTQEMYANTLRIILRYDAHPSFASIDKKWLDCLRSSMCGTSTNYQNIQLRNIRAVFNYALEQGYEIRYPFKGYKIKNTETQMRDLSPTQLARIFSQSGPYIDLFKLQFYLIGINLKDIFNLKPSDYSGGRIKYKRAKTGKPYSIKVEPEAKEILDRYPGKNHLLSIFDTYSSHRYFFKYYHEALNKACRSASIPFSVTSYYSRYSWATIAYNECEIPLDVISAALGHSYGNRITVDYIHRSQREVDIANRKVLDFVRTVQV